MIPIVSLVNILNSALALLFALYLYRRTHTSHNQVARLFVIFFLCYAMMWLGYGLPGILAYTPQQILFSQRIADFMLFITSMVGLHISFFAINKSRQKMVWLSLFFITTVVYLALSALYNTPHTIVIHGPYIYYQPTIPQWLAALPGSVASIASIIFIWVFFTLARRAGTDTSLRSKSMHFVFGMTCILVAAIFFFIFSIATPRVAMVSSLLSIVGLLIMMRGVLQEGAYA